MRSLILMLALLVAPAGWVTAQGRVDFNNYLSGNAIWTYSGIQTHYVGADYSIQLRWAAGTYTDIASFEAANPAASLPVVFFGATGGSPLTDGAGLFDGGTVAIGSVGTYTAQARGWFNNGFYPSYQQALLAGGGTGSSGLFTIIVTALPTPANTTVFPSFEIGSLQVTPTTPKLDVMLVNGQAIVTWPTIPKSVLQSATTLDSGSWLDIAGPYIILNGRYTVTNNLSGPGRYFRLRY